MVLSLSYAALQNTIYTNEVVNVGINASNEGFIYIENNETIDLSGEYAQPISDVKAMNASEYNYVLNVYNSYDETVAVNLYAVILNDSGLSNYIRYTFYEKNNQNQVNAAYLFNEKTPLEINNDNYKSGYIINNDKPIYIAKNDKKTVHLHVWIDENAPDETQNQSLTILVASEKNDIDSSVLEDLEENRCLESIYTNPGSEEYTIQKEGYYLLETWGAQGGSAGEKSTGGYGSYAKAIAYLFPGTTIYLSVGGKGLDAIENGEILPGGFNGGGNSFSLNSLMASGGGATHLSLIKGENGLLSELEQYKGKEIYNSNNKIVTYDSDKIIMVASGGGGAIYPSEKTLQNSGGGYKSQNSSQLSSKPSEYQNTIKAGFGQGEGASTNEIAIPGSGGGWFGGSIENQASSGGTSYIGSSLITDKEIYCYNCETSLVESTYTKKTTCINENPTKECTKIGDGAAKITYLGLNKVENCAS